MEKTNLNIIINEQHTLLPQQVEVIKHIFDPAAYRHILVKVPAQGWDRLEQDACISMLEGVVLFISPIPRMIKLLSEDALLNQFQMKHSISKVTLTTVLCNDTREKVELPNGKIIHKISETGWYIS